MFIAILFFVLNILNSHAKSVHLYDEPIRATETGQKTAERIKEFMNPNVDPCNDFYQYACGNWSRDPENNINLVLQRRVNNKLKDILNAVTSSEKNSSLVKAKMFFESCINTGDDKDMSDLLSIMDMNGGWPMITSQNDWIKRKSWREVDLAYRKITNHSPFFYFGVIDLMQRTHNPFIVINYPLREHNKYIFSDYLPERFESFISLPKVRNYMNVIKDISKIIAKHRNYTLSEKILEKDARNIIKFEWNLEWIIRNLTINLLDQYGDSFDITTIDKFQKKYDSTCYKTKKSKINWLKMIKKFFDDVPEVNIKGSQMISVIKNFFPILSDLLNQTPLRVIVNTIHWQFITNFSRYTNYQIHTKLKETSGPSTIFFASATRHTQCRKILHEEFVHALANSFVQKHFSEEIKNISLDIGLEIAHEMGALINRSTLYNYNAKIFRYLSTKNYNWFIGYPDWYDNKTEIDHYYDKVEISQSWLDNVLNMKKFNLNQKLKSLIDRSITQKNWMFSPIIVNAYFNNIRHAIILPAAILQSPVIDKNQSDALNYGSIGFTIGYEIAHAIQIINPYDTYGNLKPWWNDTNFKIRESIDCFIDQFSNYSLLLNNKTYKVNPFKTLEYNVADTLGLRVAYEAFQTHKSKVKKLEIKLPGLENLDSNQLFFLSYAQTECGSQHHEKLIEEMTGSYNPPMFRVIGSLSNNKNFAEAFQCSRETKMNPIKKCFPL